MEEYVMTLPQEEVKVLRPVAKRFGWGFKKLCENFNIRMEGNSPMPPDVSVSYVVKLPQEDVEFLSQFAEKANWNFMKADFGN